MRVFLDTNVFVNGIKHRESNSHQVLELAEQGSITVFTSEFALKEVSVVLRHLRGIRAAYIGVKYVQGICVIVPRRKISASVKEFRGKIKDKDLENLATAKAMKIGYLISFDREYELFPEYLTPKQFVKHLGLAVSETEY